MFPNNSRREVTISDAQIGKPRPSLFVYLRFRSIVAQRSKCSRWFWGTHSPSASSLLFNKQAICYPSSDLGKTTDVKVKWESFSFLSVSIPLKCGSLDESGPHRFTREYSVSSCCVWEGSGGVASLGGGHSTEGQFQGFKKPMQFPVCLKLVDQDVSSQFLFQHHACLLPCSPIPVTMTLILCNPKQTLCSLGCLDCSFSSQQ